MPLALYFKDGRAKVEIALAKGKKEYDKRQTLREKQDRRETDRAISAARRRQRGLSLASEGTGQRPARREYAGTRRALFTYDGAVHPHEGCGHHLENINMGMIGFDSGCRSRGSEPRKRQ